MKSHQAWIIFLLAVIAIFVKLFFNAVEQDQLIWKLDYSSESSWMSVKSAYARLMLFTFFSVFICSFGPFGRYYKIWSAVIPAIIAVAIPFILWDMLFSHWEVWGFQKNYTSELYLLKMPIEEYIFFFAVPFACMYIYYMVNRWFHANRKASDIEKYFSIGISILLLVVGIWKWDHMYTSTTFLLSGSLLLLHVIYGDASYRSNFWICFLICLIPFYFINGFLTGSWMENPIVVYNPNEYFGTRIGTIPLDDFVYCFLLLFSVSILTEKQLKKQLKGFF